MEDVVARMEGVFGRTMEREAVEAYIAGRGHGVLSLAAENESYAIPMSFGFDEPHERIVMDLVVTDDGTKWAYIEATETATAVLYDFANPEDWRSVVVRGSLDTVDQTEDDFDRTVAWFVEQEEGVADDQRWFDDPRADWQWVSLSIDEITGRRSSD